ncbi:MAG: phosphoribosylglycinamide formyltransferase [Alphaproteobacteria bacterium]|nr:phosphoribosylglycinamide formyltransferase [Alphaproteobacteria bacterium]
MDLAPVKKLHIAVFISGGGSNLQALIDACSDPDFPAQIGLVIANRPDAYGLKRAEKAGIPAIIVDHKAYENREGFETALSNALNTIHQQHPIDLVCLAGFMRILSAEFIEHWAGRIINTHPALLPKFGGPGMYGTYVHEAVLAANERESGASIHYVIPEVDQGPVILQQSVPVLPGDTPETLAERVIAQEHILYPEAIRILAEKLL